ncbi:MAG: hypothetical protein HYR63_15880 [Proteobacteria bacterium]|nr:hypothetical protein [Pseudomonadota bacterium]MBI3499693.1 hypothetical protein [Pseudomonadota bacterium]
MSRLDSHIRRLEAQRACLDTAIALIGGAVGPVLELGLGNGRTYDHLRQNMPGRAIFVFERILAAHPTSIPDPPFLILGDFRETLPGALQRLGAPAVLAHADFGSGNAAATAAVAEWLGLSLPMLLAPGAVVACDQTLVIPGAAALSLPAGVAEGRYHLWQMPG